MARKKSENKGKGFWGKVLTVNLSERTTTLEDVEEGVYRQVLSGAGLGARMLWDRMEPGADPMGPGNILGLTTGALTDTPSLFSGRFTAVGKSPSTGGWGDANCGGYFSPFLKRCGVDAVFFTGAADRPVYLYMDGEKAEIRDASELWGQDTMATEKWLAGQHGKRIQVASIGMAGEKQSFMAGIANDGGRMAARSGLGGVMGSKNLKAVVVAGKLRVDVADKARMQELTHAYRARLDKLSFAQRFLNDRLLGMTGLITRLLPVYPRQPADLWRLLLRKFGTPCLTAMGSESGDSPIKNWSGAGVTDFPLKRAQRIGAESVIRFERKKYGCFSCPIRCGGIVKVDQGPYRLEESHKPEYESICAFGALLLNDDLYSIFKLNDMCNRAGIDTISTGGTVAFAIECFENGLLTEKDTGGLRLSWGHPESIMKLTEKIIAREGIGDVLADGVKKAAETMGGGAEKYAVHCGGMEAPMHDPKLDPGYGISYYLDPTPGRHTIASMTYLEIQNLEKKFSRAVPPGFFSTDKSKLDPHGKAEAIATGVFFKTLVDAAGVCLFGTQAGGGMPLPEWLNAATGWDLTPDEYLVVGERIEQYRNAFNVREGLNARRDFKPHPRIWGGEPLDRGPHKGRALDMEAMARSFYRVMNWDWETATPGKEYLLRLGLTDLAAAMHP